jgi:hypothetical protein
LCSDDTTFGEALSRVVAREAASTMDLRDEIGRSGIIREDDPR